MLSAVEGIAVISPSAYEAAMPVTLAILFLLFMAQRFGTSKVSILFSPVISLWFFSLFAIGIYNITKYPYVLVAFSPSFAFEYFIRNGYTAWVSLGAVVLCVTGTEALYADIGHFSANAVRLSWTAVAYPSLLMAYCGQAAVLVVNPAAISNTFYNALPDGFLLPMLILATLATIIASQALISAAFSLVMQAMSLQCFPRVTIIHTDKHHEGQIYIPEINYILMIGCLIITASFQHSANLVVAYGIAVCTVMLIDMTFYSVAIPLVFKKPWPLGVLFFVSYLVVDVSFLSANLLKFVSGGWFPLVLSAVISSIMITWRWGRLAVSARMTKMALPDSKLTFRRPPEMFDLHAPPTDAEEPAPWPLNDDEESRRMREQERRATLAGTPKGHGSENGDDEDAGARDKKGDDADHDDNDGGGAGDGGAKREHSGEVDGNASTDPAMAADGLDDSGVSTRATRAPTPTSNLSPRTSIALGSSTDLDKGGSSAHATATDGDDDDDGDAAAGGSPALRQRPAALRRLTMVRDRVVDTLGEDVEAPEGDPMPLVPGVFFYFSSTSGLVPAAFAHLIRRIPFRPKLLVFITMTSVNVSRVEDGLTVSPVGELEGIYRAVLNVGYAQGMPDMAILAARILRKLHYIPPSLRQLRRASLDLLAAEQRRRLGDDSLPSAKEDAAGAGVGTDGADRASISTTASEVAEWATDDAYVAAADPTLLMGRDQVFARAGSPWWHRLRVAAFSLLVRVSRAQTVALRIPASNLVEVGYRVDI